MSLPTTTERETRIDLLSAQNVETLDTVCVTSDLRKVCGVACTYCLIMESNKSRMAYQEVAVERGAVS